LEQKLGLNIKPLTKQQLITETQSVIVKLAAVREVIQKDTNAIPQIVFINNIEQNSRDALNFSLQQFKYPYSTKIRGRFVLDDMFLIFGVGGQYLPFVGEGNVDDAVFYSRKPFYLMHEMAHGNGFTEESECNFLAYISCVRSGNLSLQYSGELNYLLYLLYDIKYREEEEYIKIKNALPSVIRKDLDALSLYQQQHAFKTAFIGDFINNTYLKILGIQEGIKNYDKMILLVYAWKYNK
jgi:hypothetical protein